MNIRHQLSRDVMIGMAKCPVTMEERWVDECTHEGGTKLLPSRDITPLIEHLIDQGWTKKEPVTIGKILDDTAEAEYWEDQHR